MRYYKIIFILLIFQSCNTTTLSKKEANNISNLRVEILIEDGVKEKSLNKINAYLYNGKKRIINENIKIQLNGKPLELFVRTGNYYDKYPVYRTDDLVRRESYYFEIILPDSTKYPLAYLKPLKKNDGAKFYIPEKNYSNENVTLKWKNINTPTTLEVWKLVQLKNKKNIKKHSKGNYSATNIKETINTKNGKYIIPKSFLNDSLTVTKHLKVRLNHQENGLINPKLLIGSSITHKYTLEKTIDIKEE